MHAARSSVGETATSTSISVMMVSGVNGVLAWPDHATMTTFIVSSIAGPELFSGGEKYRTALK